MLKKIPISVKVYAGIKSDDIQFDIFVKIMQERQARYNLFLCVIIFFYDKYSVETLWEFTQQYEIHSNVLYIG